MVESGNIFINRKAKQDYVPFSFKIIRLLTPILFPHGQFDKFTPDILLKDGQELSDFGLSAKIVSIPGHSKGSIGVLMANGDFFCGDLLVNVSGKPRFPMIDDIVAARASVEKLKTLDIKMIYPGHGTPFTIENIKS